MLSCLKRERYASSPMRFAKHNSRTLRNKGPRLRTAWYRLRTVQPGRQCRLSDKSVYGSWNKSIGGTAQYNISFTLRLEGTLDFAALKSALSAVVQRHETLRTRYIHAEGQLQLEIPAELEVSLPVTDFSGIEQGRREDLLSAALHAEANRPIVLDRDPVIRAALYRMDECEHMLQLTVHHIASDGWSMGVLFRDFAAFYDAGVNWRGRSAS